jgi:hypothetical protein
MSINTEESTAAVRHAIMWTRLSLCTFNTHLAMMIVTYTGKKGEMKYDKALVHAVTSAGMEDRPSNLLLTKNASNQHACVMP